MLKTKCRKHKRMLWACFVIERKDAWRLRSKNITTENKKGGQNFQLKYLNAFCASAFFFEL